MSEHYRLLISCPDTTGIVAAVSQFVAEQGGSLCEATYHSERDDKWFFMLNEMIFATEINTETFTHAFQPIANKFDMKWRLTQKRTAKKVALMVSKHSHCLMDILHRWHSGDLNCEIVAIISNHDTLQHAGEWYGIPFHVVDMQKSPEDSAEKHQQKKQKANHEIIQLLQKYHTDTVVLARYMQIIPEEICDLYAGNIINIHHSFLPSFIGANPYERAYKRGVKLIGATCHYVTKELDKGPIIEQDIVRVSHRHTKNDMKRLGKDVEKTALARGLEKHLDDRVMIYGNRTIILE